MKYSHSHRGFSPVLALHRAIPLTVLTVWNGPVDGGEENR
jgi:hypothetical protein